MTKIKSKEIKKKCKESVQKQSIPSECEGYKVIRLKCYEDSSAIHCVLAKEHSVREKCKEKPEDRTVFLRSVPPFVTKEALIRAFGKFGEIREVYFHPTPCASVPPSNISRFFEDVPPIYGFKVAYVVFAQEEGARNTLLSPADETLILFEKKPTETVLDRWINEYNQRVNIDSEALKKEVDDYMAQYDESKEEMEVKEKQKHEEEEAEDGWVTVTRKSGIPRKESVHKKIMKKQDNRTKKTQLMNFYRFQIRESKMNQLVKLREKFEEDKKKITQLKESRKFKPF
uniref:Ribosomal RNA-processing protein 7 C-terminal domain-containing protein n=1 Tax=Lygus hesperus TaxID=30085 RepID=A0A0A9XBH4_LYGHE